MVQTAVDLPTAHLPCAFRTLIRRFVVEVSAVWYILESVSTTSPDVDSVISQIESKYLCCMTGMES
jgi:hypothetical protein